MSMEWYRAYHGMPNDPKLQVVAKRSGQPTAHVVAVWVCILDAASQHDPRGIFNIDPEEISVIQGIEVEIVEDILESLKSKNLVDENGNVVNWHKRQHTTSTERSKKSRAKKQAASSSNNLQHDATSCSSLQQKNKKNTTDTDRDTESDTDEITDTNSKTNTEKRTREQKKKSSRRKNTKSVNKYISQMLDIWNSEVQSKLTSNQKAILTPKRRELLNQRWVEDFDQSIDAWKYFCEIIGNSDFCLGKIEGKDWTIDLTWAIESSEHIAKILEGGFSGGSHPPKPPLCEVEELKEAWEFVLFKLQRKHGAQVIRCWFAGSILSSFSKTDDGSIVTLTCPRKFIKKWIEEKFLNDLNRAFADQQHFQSPFITVELTSKED